VILFIDSSGKEEIMPGKAAKVPLSEKQLELLHKISRETTASVRLGQRSRIILLAFEGWLNEEIADEVSLNQRQVGRWRRRHYIRHG